MAVIVRSSWETIMAEVPDSAPTLLQGLMLAETGKETQELR
jgi:hypothetical protein